VYCSKVRPRISESQKTLLSRRKRAVSSMPVSRNHAGVSALGLASTCQALLRKSVTDRS
jgi:hypothetical protein